MMADDSLAAKVARIDEEGRVADFQALRHTFITNLTRGGVAPKVAQALARHSTITLTLDRYTHLRPEDELRALDVLPDLLLPESAAAAEERRATGTDSCAVLPPCLLSDGADACERMPVPASAEAKDGARGRARTYDLMIKSHLLYQLSYAGTPSKTGAGRILRDGATINGRNGAGIEDRGARAGAGDDARAPAPRWAKGVW